jgi:hypothetical protein
LLSFDRIVGERSREGITSDHGAGWGNGMERSSWASISPKAELADRGRDGGRCGCLATAS